jgi:hypothetical protein
VGSDLFNSLLLRIRKVPSFSVPHVVAEPAIQLQPGIDKHFRKNEIFDRTTPGIWPLEVPLGSIERVTFAGASVLMKRLPGWGALIRWLMADYRGVVGRHHSERV